MMATHGSPRIGRSVVSHSGQATQPIAQTDSVVEELTAPAPKPEVLGEIKFKPGRTDPSSPEYWAQRIAAEAGPPPWENRREDSSARQFVECPKDWVLYWVNPEMLNRAGWRGWTPVSPSDPRVRIRVDACVAVDNTVRRGGDKGDILAYMPRHWYEQRKREREKGIADATQGSVDRMTNLNEQFKRGKFPGVSLASAIHPRDTIAHPDDMRD